MFFLVDLVTVGVAECEDRKTNKMQQLDVFY
jgi:hypothetical protein